MAEYTNTNTQARIWTFLVDRATGRTLGLAPDESADVGIWVTPKDKNGTPTGEADVVEDLPADFEDEWLKPAASAGELAQAVKTAPKTAMSKGATPDTAEATADAPTLKE